MAPPFGKLGVPVSLFLGVAIVGGSVLWGFRDLRSPPFLTAQVGDPSAGVDTGGTTGGGSSSIATCGNGTREGAEACDDGNLMSGDGCTGSCAVESGYTCANTNPDTCTTSCGDGTVAGIEQCESPFGTCCNALTCLFKSSSTECRASAGVCDIAENCTGSAATCPSDSVRASGYQCAALDAPTPAAPTPYTHEGTHRRDCNGTDVTCPAGANNAPSVGTIADQSTTVNNAVTISVTASDSDSDTLYFSATGMPTGATLTTDTATTAHIGGTPAQVGTFTVTVTAADGFGGQATRSFTWNIAPSFVVTLSSSAASSAASSVASSVASSASSVSSQTSSASSGSSAALCGNGALNATEQCDDGNTQDGDGCDRLCTVETGWTCGGDIACSGGASCPVQGGTGTSSANSSGGSASSFNPDGCNIPKILFYNLQSGYSAYNAEGATLQNAGWDVTIHTRASHPAIDLNYLKEYSIVWFYNGCNGTVGMPTPSEIAAIGEYYIGGGHLVFGTDAANGDAYQGPGTCFARVNAITQRNLGVQYSGSLDRHSSRCWSVVGSHPLFYNGANVLAAHSDAIISLTNNVQWGTTQPSIPGSLLDGYPALAFTEAENGHGQAMFLPNETTILASCPASLKVFENYAGLAGYKKSCPAGGSSSSNGGSILSALWSRLLGLLGMNTAPQSLVAQVSGTSSSGGNASGGYCSPVCGDGIVVGSEQCDDGNTRDGDGCDSLCRTEGSSSSGGSESSACSVTGSLRQLSGLATITIYEKTGIVDAHTFGVNDSRLMMQVTGGADFTTAAAENYDIFYSDADGTPDPDGAYISIGALYNETFPDDQSSNNIDAVKLTFIDGSIAYADLVADVELGTYLSAPFQQAQGYASRALGAPDDLVPKLGDNLSRLTLGFPAACGSGSSSNGSNASSGSSAGLCGNGVRQGSEECDDGNTRDGDGCDRLCETENNWQCFAGSGACPQPLDCSKDTAGGSCTDHSFHCPPGKTLYDADIACGTASCPGTCRVCSGTTNSPPSGGSSS